MHNHQLVSFILCIIFFGTISAQVEITSELYRTFQQKDSILFEAGFNNCELESLANELTGDLEFYHDQGGFQDKEAFMTAMKENICSSPERKPIRKLTPNTLKVFPMYNNGTIYGALVEGKHEFYIREEGKQLYKTGSALFSGLWLKEGEIWKVRRIYSYHHQPE